TDHGEISYDILDKLDCKQLFDLTDEQIHVLKMGVKYHTKPYNGEDSKVALCTKIIKNADAMANVNTTANASHKIHTSVDGVTKEILDSFINMEPLWAYKYKTKLDRCLMLTANCYYVRYPFLRKEILECNFIDIMYESFSKYLNDEDKKIYKNAVEKMKVSYTSSCQKTIEQIENESKFVF
ncbi:MAG: hypothetical protein J6Q51_01825, partial [Clostridia bacterium]|nr:hypothetical protein [Clostridia bacterium]